MITVGLKKTSNGFTMTDCEAENHVSFVVTEAATDTLLSYHDFSQLGMVLNEKKVYDRFRPETECYKSPQTYDISIFNIDGEAACKTNLDKPDEQDKQAQSAQDENLCDEKIVSDCMTNIHNDTDNQSDDDWLVESELMSENDEPALPCHEDTHKVLTLTQRDIASINSILPFARVTVFDKKESPNSTGIACSMLIDSGASLSLIRKETLDKSGLTFEEFESEVLVKGFTGHPVKIETKVKVFIDFGNSVRHEMYFHTFSGPSSYDILIGWSQMKNIGLELHSSDNNFKIDGMFFEIHDFCKMESIINNVVIDKPASLKPMTVTVDSGVTLRGDDEFHMKLNIDISKGGDCEDGNLFYLELDDQLKSKGLELADHVVQVFKTNVRKHPYATMVYLRIKEDAEVRLISLPSGSEFGKLKAILPPSFQETVDTVEDVVEQFVITVAQDEDEAVALKKWQEQEFKRIRDNFVSKSLDDIYEYVKNTVKEPVESIILFPKRRVLTDSKQAEFEQAKIEQDAKYTREFISENFKDAFSSVPEKYQSQALELLYEN